MYRVYKVTDRENDNVVKARWDGDTTYYDVYESQTECDEDEKRLAKIDEDYNRQMSEYLKSEVI